MVKHPRLNTVYLSVCLSICLSVLFVCLSVCLLSVCLFVCLSICLFVCLSVCLSISFKQCSPQNISKAWQCRRGKMKRTCGRGHLSGVCWLCGAVQEQHRVLVFGLKC